jgi:hypothetical protein
MKIKVVKNLGNSIGDPTRQLAETMEKSAKNEQRLTLIGQYIAMGQHDLASKLAKEMQTELFGNTSASPANSPARVRARREDNEVGQELLRLSRQDIVELRGSQSGSDSDEEDDSNEEGGNDEDEDEESEDNDDEEN